MEQITGHYGPSQAELDFSFLDLFEEVRDPRIDRHKRYPLPEVLISAVVGVLCGAETWDDVVLYANNCLDWMRDWLPFDFENGIPSHDTYRRVFSLIDETEFERLFSKWSAWIVGDLEAGHIAIDGKKARGSFLSKEDTNSAVHLVSAWASDIGFCLGQVNTQKKSNEITAIPELLELLKIKGTVVTVDALNTQKEIASIIREKGGDYVFPVKKITELYAKNWKRSSIKQNRKTIQGLSTIRLIQRKQSMDVMRQESSTVCQRAKQESLDDSILETNGSTSTQL
jgi:predicted transposase YbfD/YdcC